MTAGATTAGTTSAPARAPLVLLAATITATTVALGLATGTGALLDPVATEFGLSTAPVSLMFSATLCAMLGTGAVTGPFAERHGARGLVVLGALLVPAGLLAVAGAGRFAVAATGFALGVGGGAGCLLVPLLTAVGTTFRQHRGPALVLATAGGGAGVVLAPPTTVTLVGALGLREALVVLAAGAAVVLALCAAAVPADRAPAGPGGSRPLVGTVPDPRFRLHWIGTVGLTAAMFVPFVHLPSYAGAHGVGAASGAGLVALSGMVSLVSRVAAAAVVARFCAWRALLVAATLLATSLALLLSSGGAPVWITVFATIFGAAHGAYVGLSPAVAAQLYGVQGLGRRLGLLHTAAALGGLLGPSTAGLAVDVTRSPEAGVVVALAFGAAGLATLAVLDRRSSRSRPGS